MGVLFLRNYYEKVTIDFPNLKIIVRRFMNNRRDFFFKTYWPGDGYKTFISELTNYN